MDHFTRLRFTKRKTEKGQRDHNITEPLQKILGLPEKWNKQNRKRSAPILRSGHRVVSISIYSHQLVWLKDTSQWNREEPPILEIILCQNVYLYNRFYIISLWRCSRPLESFSYLSKSFVPIKMLAPKFRRVFVTSFLRKTSMLCYDSVLHPKAKPNGQETWVILHVCMSRVYRDSLWVQIPIRDYVVGLTSPHLSLWHLQGHWVQDNIKNLLKHVLHMISAFPGGSRGTRANGSTAEDLSPYSSHKPHHHRHERERKAPKIHSSACTIHSKFIYSNLSYTDEARFYQG